MSTLGKGKGIFKLDYSDYTVGSFFSEKDLATVLEINNLEGFHKGLVERKLLNKDGLVDESKLYKHFRELKNAFSNEKALAYASFDEYVLKAIFKRAYPDIKIEQQVKVKAPEKKRPLTVDFRLTKDDKVIYVEFDGPGHFTMNRGKEPANPLERLKEIEDATGCEAVSWPFWIQRCEANVKALFEHGRGYGALWSTNIMFGDFFFDNSADIILTITKRFDAILPLGIGYFYLDDTNRMIKPVHPVIDKILKGKESTNRLIPKGTKESDRRFWLPACLWLMDK